MPEGGKGWRPPGYEGPGWIPPPGSGGGGGGLPPDGRGGGRGSGGTAWRYAVLILLAVWTLLAFQWHSQNDCEMPESYGLVLSHGTPDPWEGCGR